MREENGSEPMNENVCFVVFCYCTIFPLCFRFGKKNYNF